MSVELLKSSLSASYVPSRPITITNEDLTLFFDMVLSGGPTTVSFYLEYTDGNPNASATVWRQEVDEADDGAGGVTHNIVTRGFGALADATYGLTLQFTRRAPYARIQIKANVAGGAITITAPYGSKPNSP